ncbi:unnamed protein product [Sphenostylis stenocarpa]|uniref:Uncharacterized protein n=1 Tax=Sphenostylis stenocarpa TaxID=92480 RepID=A0AA86S870_9FABA|nr:unnamed protein product [Sphenostylis stenocarpa]
MHGINPCYMVTTRKWRKLVLETKSYKKHRVFFSRYKNPYKLKSSDCITSVNNHIVCNIKDHDKTATTTTITSGYFFTWSCRIGTEHEKFGFEFGSLRPMKYEQIAELLNDIAERFDWDKIMEDDKIIGLKRVCEVSLRIGNKHRGNVTEVK